MLWSLTPFRDELDILEIRLAELDRVVDVHVIAEASVTQTGKPKPLVYEENADRFDRWAHKIRHVVVDDMPDGSAIRDDWKREHHQRDALIRGCDGLSVWDTVLVSDVDEIPSAKFVRDLGEITEPTRLSMNMHPYKLDWRWPEKPVLNGTRATLVPAPMVREHALSWLVEHDRPWNRAMGVAGWHLAYQGGVDAILGKIPAMADAWIRAEAVTPELVQLSLDTGRDLFGRAERQADRVQLTKLPAYVRENPEKFEHMLIPNKVLA